MKRIFQNSWLLILAIFPGPREVFAAKSSIGSIAGFVPPVELRAGPAGEIVKLDPARDNFRTLYAGDQLRCGPGGSVTTALLMNRTNVFREARWTEVPDYNVEYSQWLPRQWFSTNTVAAGRTRGATKARRAVLVGINVYRPSSDVVARLAAADTKKPKRGSWENLDGCVNDVEAVRALLIARFGFNPADIVTLTDQQATRAAILDALRNRLLNSSEPGDAVFFFYAGHGSQVVNSRSEELDKRDETIVPADSWRGEADIRDKELRRLFNAMLDKGVVLTAIFDSCHSGSIARGNFTEGKSRHATPIVEDISDPADYGPRPEERGALVLSAAQDDQLAGEQSEGNVSHGAFTAALIKTLRLAPVTSSSGQLFLSIKSVLQSQGRAQEPVLAGLESRRRMGLFGDGSTDLSGKTTVAVERVAVGGEVRLQGGRALGLNEGCQLKRSAGEGSSPRLRLEVTRVDSLASAAAKVIEGNAESIRPGDVFEVARWVQAPEAMLRVWVPPAMPTAQFEAAIKLADQLRRSTELEWIEDPTVASPTHVLSWGGQHWTLTSATGTKSELTATVSVDQVLGHLRGAGGRPRLFVSLPPTAELREAFRLGQGTPNSAIELVASASAADYLLVGGVRAGQCRYAWVLPNASEGDAERFPLPLRTDWFPTNSQPDTSTTLIGSQLEDRVLRLGKVKSWLALSSPSDSAPFPYHLAFSNVASDATISGDTTASFSPSSTTKIATMSGGQSYRLLLRAKPEDLKAGVERRYVYVFALDSAGSSKLLWPARGQGNVENYLPVLPAGGEIPAAIPLRVSFTIRAPFGTDTYVLLTSREAIPETSVFEFDGVRGTGEPGGTRGGSSPLQNLLKGVGSATRGVAVEAPVDWSIERLSIRSVPN